MLKTFFEDNVSIIINRNDEASTLFTQIQNFFQVETG